MSLLLFLLACSDYELTSTVEPPEETCNLQVEAYAPAIVSECASEPEIGSFTPVVEWTWDTNPISAGYEQIMAAPAVANLSDDNGDGLIDDEDVPDVVFTAFTGGAYTSAGALVAISGADGSTLWSVTDVGGYQPYGASGVAIADLYASGDPTVLVSAAGGLLAVDATGGFRWFAPVPVTAYGHPAVGDIDADGAAEVIYGASVVNADGTVRWTGTAGTGSSRYLSFPADLDNDGVQEIVAGNTVYAVDGSILWNDGGTDGAPAIADFDGDRIPEIVRVGGGVVRLSDSAGNVLWEFPLDDGGGGPPTIADFDGDGAPEVGVASRSYYRVIETDGTERWRTEVQDYSSSVTGSSVFDFEGDGAAEVVYADEETLWVYDGATGAVEMAWDSHSSGTLFEYPLVVDVDQDGAAEIIVASNDYAYKGSRGITVIGDADDSWAPARPVWNQHAYSITNVRNDGAVPVTPIPTSYSWNSFRAGNSETRTGLALPDLTVGEPESCTLECDRDSVELWIPVENIGTAHATNVSVALWAGDLVIATEQFNVVAAGEARWVGPIDVDRKSFDRGLRLQVDDDGTGLGRIEECNEADNAWVWTEWPC